MPLKRREKKVGELEIGDAVWALHLRVAGRGVLLFRPLALVAAITGKGANVLLSPAHGPASRAAEEGIRFFGPS